MGWDSLGQDLNFPNEPWSVFIVGVDAVEEIRRTMKFYFREPLQYLKVR